MVHRQIEAQILKDLDSKIVLLSGPRQCGKTYLSRQLFADSQVYLNSDSPADHKVLREGKNWKRWLKGLYDTEGVRDKALPAIEIRSAASWLAGLEA